MSTTFTIILVAYALLIGLAAVLWVTWFVWRIAKQSPAPQEWYDEDQGDVFCGCDDSAKIEPASYR